MFASILLYRTAIQPIQSLSSDDDLFVHTVIFRRAIAGVVAARVLDAAAGVLAGRRAARVARVHLAVVARVPRRAVAFVPARRVVMYRIMDTEAHWQVTMTKKFTCHVVIYRSRGACRARCSNGLWAARVTRPCDLCLPGHSLYLDYTRYYKRK